MNLIRTSTRYQLREANQSLVTEHGRLASLADQAVCEASSHLKGAIDAVVHRAQMRIGEQAAIVEKTANILTLKTESATEAARCDLEHDFTELRRESRRLTAKAADDLEAGRAEVETGSASMAKEACSRVEGHIRLVIGMGPQSALQRGFSIAKGLDGRPITSRAAAARNAEFTVQFHDGAIQVSNEEFQGGNEP